MAALSANQNESIGTTFIQSNWVNWQHFHPIELSQLTTLSANWNWVNWQHFQPVKIDSTDSTFSQSIWGQPWQNFQPINTESTSSTLSQSNWVNWQHFQPIDLRSTMAALSANRTESTDSTYSQLKMSQLAIERNQLAALSANRNCVKWHHFQPIETESSGTTFI